ncbi:PLP-dependent aminotransferase family protein [Pokkaliibacter sp. CJK22405]|uniref:aminotransferase-like domain-containing protein n=1 Tax=Pokkaliibacter sp. CJK22405 TaxID=3384615 RepID=UPI00398539E3
MVTIWNPDLSVFQGPRYLAIADALAAAIEQGELEVNQRLPTHRALADQLGVTVGTITRAYAEAERRGLVEARVGSGTYVRLQGQLVSRPWKIEHRDDWANLGVTVCVPDDREASFRSALDRVLQQNLNPLLEHNQEAGIPAHREQYGQWLAMIGLQPPVEQLVMTAGGQQGILLSLLSTLNPGDTLACEALAYPGLLLTARKLNLKVLPVAMDEDGPLPESLELICRERRPKAFYCTPTLQNPTSRIFSLKRREALLEVCQRHGLWVIEDDINGWTPRERPVPMAALAPEQVLHISGISKALSGGIRVAGLVAPLSLIDAVHEAIRSVCWVTSPFLTAIVGEWIVSGEAARLLERQRDALTHRCDLARSILGTELFECAPISNHGWINLPEPWLSHHFVQAADAAKVQLFGSEHFSAGRQIVHQGVRLSLSHPATLAELELGLTRVREILKRGPEPAPGVR